MVAIKMIVVAVNPPTGTHSKIIMWRRAIIVWSICFFLLAKI